MSDMEFSSPLPNELETEHLGLAIANALEDGIVIYLCGDLGAGKTRLAQAIINGLGFEGHVKSPTYTLVESYSVLKGTVYHFDLYRLMDPMELEYMGIQDYFDQQSVILIEWPDKGGTMIEQADVEIQLSFANSGRNVHARAKTAKGEMILSKLKQNL